MQVGDYAKRGLYELKIIQITSLDCIISYRNEVIDKELVNYKYETYKEKIFVPRCFANYKPE